MFKHPLSNFDHRPNWSLSSPKYSAFIDSIAYEMDSGVNSPNLLLSGLSHAENDGDNYRVVLTSTGSLDEISDTATLTTPEIATHPVLGVVQANRVVSATVSFYQLGPDGTKGVFKDSLVCRDFNPDDIIKYRLKEEWVFDKESSRLYVRILGLAPMKTYLDESGNLLGESPMFWVYYPDLRTVLAKYDVHNTKNIGGRMSWEELFESRNFDTFTVEWCL
ncbi:hypothetical protein EBT16_07990 [bacterium]|nr:hypothetical protein [bacterium]